MCALVYSYQLSDTAQQMYNWAELQVPLSVSQFKPKGALCRGQVAEPEGPCVVARQTKKKKKN